MTALTPRQQVILEFIKRHNADYGFPPTRAEICHAMGFKSPNSAEEHLRSLERKGAIQIMAGTTRGIKVIDQPKREKTDNELRDYWRMQGGRFHGPNVETGTMPESVLLPLLRKLLKGK